MTGMKSTSLSSLKDSLEEETGSVFAERVDGEVPGASTFSVKLLCCSLLQDSSPGRVESKKSVFPSEKRIGQDIWPGSFWLIILQFVSCPTIPFSRQNGHSFFASSVYVNLSLRESYMKKGNFLHPFQNIENYLFTRRHIQVEDRF